MLRQILGKQIIELDLGRLLTTINHRSVILDLGCGDGLYSYRQALQNPDIFHIAVDANSQVLQKLSKKVEHEGIDNLIYLQHAAESLPPELNNQIDKLVILYPWGSLLKIVIEADRPMRNILRMLKSNAALEIVFTYSPEYEQAMIAEYGLPVLSTEFIKNLHHKLSNLDLKEIDIVQIVASEVINQTSWGKKINSKRERIVWKILAANQ